MRCRNNLIAGRQNRRQSPLLPAARASRANTAPATRRQKPAMSGRQKGFCALAHNHRLQSNPKAESESAKQNSPPASENMPLPAAAAAARLVLLFVVSFRSGAIPAIAALSPVQARRMPSPKAHAPTTSRRGAGCLFAPPKAQAMPARQKATAKCG